MGQTRNPVIFIRTLCAHVIRDRYSVRKRRLIIKMNKFICCVGQRRKSCLGCFLSSEKKVPYFCQASQESSPCEIHRGSPRHSQHARAPRRQGMEEPRSEIGVKTKLYTSDESRALSRVFFCLFSFVFLVTSCDS